MGGRSENFHNRLHDRRRNAGIVNRGGAQAGAAPDTPPAPRPRPSGRRRRPLHPRGAFATSRPHMATMPAERCRSGRTGRSRKPLWAQVHPGFESLSLRHTVSSSVRVCVGTDFPPHFRGPTADPASRDPPSWQGGPAFCQKSQRRVFEVDLGFPAMLRAARGSRPVPARMPARRACGSSSSSVLPAVCPRGSHAPVLARGRQRAASRRDTSQLCHHGLRWCRVPHRGAAPGARFRRARHWQSGCHPIQPGMYQ
jgi:hypothetical protein